MPHIYVITYLSAQIGSMIEAIASYSISSKDLKAILMYLNVSNNTWVSSEYLALCRY